MSGNRCEPQSVALCCISPHLVCHDCQSSHLMTFVMAAMAAGLPAFLLTIGPIALEGARFGKLGIGGAFGWLSRDYLLRIGCATITFLSISDQPNTALCHSGALRNFVGHVVQIFGSCAGDCGSYWSEHGLEVHLTASDNSFYHDGAFDWCMHWCAHPPVTFPVTCRLLLPA